MAIVNPSNNEQTIRGMYSLLKTDNYTLDKTLIYCSYIDPEFKIAYKTFLSDYWDYLSESLIEMELPERFYYSPTGFSQFYYGTPDFDFLVLFFAQIPTLTQFDKKKIKVFPKEKIPELNKLFISEQEAVQDSYDNPKFFEERLFS